MYLFLMTGVRFPLGTGMFSLHLRVQISSGVHPASYPMATGGALPPKVKRPMHES